MGALSSLSENGLKSLGLLTVASNLHQEICLPGKTYRMGRVDCITYTLEVHVRFLDLNPTRTLDPSFENEEFK